MVLPWGCRTLQDKKEETEEVTLKLPKPKDDARAKWRLSLKPPVSFLDLILSRAEDRLGVALGGSVNSLFAVHRVGVDD